MEKEHSYTFRKVERLCSKRQIDALFSGSGKSLSVYPLRAVYMPLASEKALPPVSVLISVSKRHFKHAVSRNRVKRQIREAYRKNKHILYEALQLSDKRVNVAFLWLADRIYSSADVESALRRLLYRISEDMVKRGVLEPEPLQVDEAEAEPVKPNHDEGAVEEL